jgi:glyoxylase-like metal-dependent hydrolase (beta-lactamase superfamily II)
VQTGSVQVKTAQRSRKPGGLLRVLTDTEWTEWLPIYVWVIDHPEGIIVVDSGETARTSEPGYFPGWHPYYRLSVRMNVRPQDEIGPQLRTMGIGEKDVRTLILTHFHTDHAGGLHHFP